MRKMMKKLCLSFIWCLSLKGMVESDYLTLSFIHDIKTRDNQEMAVKIFMQGAKTLFYGQIYTFNIKRRTSFSIEFVWFTSGAVRHVETWDIKNFDPLETTHSFNLSFFLNQSEITIDFCKKNGVKYLDQNFEPPFFFIPHTTFKHEIKKEEEPQIYSTKEKENFILQKKRY